MKRLWSILCLLSLLLSLAACGAQPAVLESDTYYIDKYVYPIAVNLNTGPEECYFDDVRLLSPTKCFIAFASFVQTEELYDEQDFWDEEQQVFVIPVKTIEDVLKTYLGDPLSDKLHALDNYDATTDTVKTEVFSGFGGVVFPRIVSKTKVDDRLTLVVDFYDETYATRQWRDEYVIDEKADHYTLVSVRLCYFLKNK